MTSNKKFNRFDIQGKMVLGQRQFDAPFSFQDQLKNEARLVHVLSGHSTLVCSGETLTLKPGTTLLMKADNFINQWHQVNNNKHVHIIGFKLTSELLQHLYADSIPYNFSNVQSKGISSSENNHTIGKCASAILLNESVLISHFIKSMIEYMNHPHLFSETMLKLKIKELIELLTNLDINGEISKMLSQLFLNQQPKLQAVVQTHLYTPLKLEDLAFLCHMSESTFSRKFKEIYGTSVIKYFTSKRLEKAQQMILQSDLSLTQVALDCGFEDLSYFSRVFKQHYQMAPSQLRKSV